MNLDHIIKSITNVKPSDKQIKRIEYVREAYKKTVIILSNNCEDSRALSISITNLETSLMWAVKSIVMEEEKNKND